MLADALADRAGRIEGACARYEARLRPWMEAAQRNVRLFTPANRSRLLVHGVVLRLAAWPILALLIKRLLNRAGARCVEARHDLGGFDDPDPPALIDELHGRSASPLTDRHAVDAPRLFGNGTSEAVHRVARENPRSRNPP